MLDTKGGTRACARNRGRKRSVCRVQRKEPGGVPGTQGGNKVCRVGTEGRNRSRAQCRGEKQSVCGVQGEVTKHLRVKSDETGECPVERELNQSVCRVQREKEQCVLGTEGGNRACASTEDEKQSAHYSTATTEPGRQWSSPYSKENRASSVYKGCKTEYVCLNRQNIWTVIANPHNKI